MQNPFRLILIVALLIGQVDVHGQQADATEGCAPHQVEFTAPAGASNPTWDFGNNGTSQLANPDRVYDEPGTYTVTYSDDNGTSTITINVYNRPIPQFVASETQGCAPLTVQFTDNTTPVPGVQIVDWNWAFEDGQGLNGQTVQKTFTEAGKWFVSLGLKTNLLTCDTTARYNNAISVSTPPDADFTTDPSSAQSCTTPLDLSLTNTSVNSEAVDYQWDFGNGNTSTDQNPTSQTYDAEGAYLVALTVTDENGCKNTKSINVTVGQPTAEFTVQDVLCAGDTAVIENTSSGGTYFWSIGLAGMGHQTSAFTFLPGNSRFSGEPEFIVGQGGTYEVELRILGNCPVSTTANIEVEEPEVTFTSDPTWSCSQPVDVNLTPSISDAASYFWTFYDGTTSNEAEPTVTYFIEDTNSYSINGPNAMHHYYNNTLTIVTQSGCSASYSSTDTVHEPNARFVADSMIRGCAPLGMTFDDRSEAFYGVASWRWIFGDGEEEFNTSGGNPSHIYADTGLYNAMLIITDSTDCIDTSFTIQIEVGGPLSLDFTADVVEVCPGEPVTFENSSPDSAFADAWHFRTELARSDHCWPSDKLTWSYNYETGPQNVTLEADQNGCISTFTKEDFIEVKGPVAEIYYTSSCDNPYEIQFVDSSHGATELIWDFGDGTTSNQAAPLHIYDTTDIYEVRLTAINTTSGCENSIDSRTIQISDIKAGFELDSLICRDEPYPFDASSSQGVYAHCNRGYHWIFHDDQTRPITTGDDVLEMSLPTTGRQNVTLVVTDLNGCTDTITESIHVYGGAANFSISDSMICFPTTLQFTDNSTADTTIIEWAWNFDDGTASALQNPEHTYVDQGEVNPQFDVQLSSRDAVGCLRKETITVETYQPTTTVNISDQSLCAGDSTFISGTDFDQQGSFLHFDWDYGNDQTSDTSAQWVTYSVPGVYDIEVGIIEDATGCPGEASGSLTVLDYPQAIFSSNQDDASIVCPGQNIGFTNSTINSENVSISYLWDFGNGLSSTFENPVSPFDTNGTYHVSLVASLATPYGCADTARNSFLVRGPKGRFQTNQDADPICKYDSVRFEIMDTSTVDLFIWDYGDGEVDSLVSPVQHQYNFVPEGGQTTAILVMTNADGTCPVTKDTVVSIHEVVADFNRNFLDVDTGICANIMPLTNTSISADSWHWEFGDGQSSNLEDVANHTYDEPGTYPISLYVNNEQLGCVDSLTKEIIIHPTPDPELVHDTICEGEQAEIIVLGHEQDWQYSWTAVPAIYYDVVSDTLLRASPMVSTVFTMMVTDEFGCSNEKQGTAIVFNPFEVPDFDTTIVVGDYIHLPFDFDSSLFSIQWIPEEGLSCLRCVDPRIQGLDPMVFEVEVADKLGCFIDQGIYTIEIYPETHIRMPTTFTPNGDGNSDVVYVEGWGIKELIKYEIYNRWGELVFETSDLNEGWDGYYKGVLQNNDTYVYKVSAMTWRDEVKDLEGHLNLMR